MVCAGGFHADEAMGATTTIAHAGLEALVHALASSSLLGWTLSSLFVGVAVYVTRLLVAE